MARGQVFTLAPSSGRLITAQSRTEQSSFALLNANDGVAYLALNRGVTDIFPSSWDWKLPSQSYGLFPGPWESLGIYYIDQSGGGFPGDFNLYDSDIKLQIPDIHSIGRALQTRSNALDIVEGAVPANPPAGTVRLWADNSGYIEKVENTGVTARIVDQRLLQSGGVTGYVLGPVMNVRGGSQSAGITPGLNSWATLSGTYAFSKVLAGTDMFITIRYCGYLNQGVGNGALNFSLQLDPAAGAGSGTNLEYFGNVFAPPSTNGVFFSVTASIYVTAIAAGTHNLRVDAFSQGANSQIFNSPGPGQSFTLQAYEVYG